MAVATGLSDGLLSLRFMQKGHSGKAGPYHISEKAMVVDEAAWDVGAAVRDAWGIGWETEGSDLSTVVTYEPSYLPLLYRDGQCTNGTLQDDEIRVATKRWNNIPNGELEGTDTSTPEDLSVNPKPGGPGADEQTPSLVLENLPKQLHHGANGYQTTPIDDKLATARTRTTDSLKRRLIKRKAEELAEIDALEDGDTSKPFRRPLGIDEPRIPMHSTPVYAHRTVTDKGGESSKRRKNLEPSIAGLIR